MYLMTLSSPRDEFRLVIAGRLEIVDVEGVGTKVAAESEARGSASS